MTRRSLFKFLGVAPVAALKAEEPECTCRWESSMISPGWDDPDVLPRGPSLRITRVPDDCPLHGGAR